MGMVNSGTNVIDKLKRLGENKAIERVGRYGISGGKICSNRGLWICRIDVQNVASLNGGAVLACVIAVLDFDHPAADIEPMLFEKVFNVIPIDGCTPVKTKNITKGCRPAQSTKPSWT